MFHEVIVALDGSDEAARAIGPASTIAWFLGVKLHVLGFHERGNAGSDLRAAIVEQMTNAGDTARLVEIDECDAPVGDLIADAARRIPGSLVVMSTHGRGRSAAVLGSVANDVLRHASVPVLLIGPACEPSAFHLDGQLVTTISSDVDEDPVVEIAAAMVSIFDLEPDIVHVLNPTESATLDAARHGVAGADLPQESAAAQRVARHIESITGTTDCDYHILHNKRPANAIVEHAKNVDATMIAMATRARHGRSRAAEGSVTADVVRHATCPVLAVAAIN